MTSLASSLSLGGGPAPMDLGTPVAFSSSSSSSSSLSISSTLVKTLSAYGIKVIKQLGYGSYSHVYLIESDNQKFALKVQQRDKLDHHLEFGREIRGLEALQSSFQFIHIHACIPFDKMTSFILDYQEDKLYDIVHTIDFVAGLNIGFQVIFALTEMKSRAQLFHCDIKSVNIFYNKTTGRVKIGDLGSSRSLEELEYSKEAISTAWYREPYFQFHLRHSRNIDTWSVGILLIELFTHAYPTQWSDSDADKDVIRFLKKVKSLVGPFPESWMSRVPEPYKSDLEKAKSGNLHSYLSQAFLVKKDERATLMQDLITRLLDYERPISVEEALVHSAFTRNNLYLEIVPDAAEIRCKITSDKPPLVHLNEALTQNERLHRMVPVSKNHNYSLKIIKGGLILYHKVHRIPFGSQVLISASVEVITVTVSSIFDRIRNPKDERKS